MSREERMKTENGSPEGGGESGTGSNSTHCHNCKKVIADSYFQVEESPICSDCIHFFTGKPEGGEEGQLFLASITSFVAAVIGVFLFVLLIRP